MNQAVQNVVTDMPQQTSPSNKLSKSQAIKIILIVLLFSLLIGGIIVMYYLILKSPVTQKPTSQTPIPATEEVPKETVSHYVGSQTITLRDESDGAPSGSAYRNISTSRVKHSITALLPDLEQDKYYQAWMIKPGNTFKLGTLSINDQGSYSLDTNFQFDSSTFLFTDFDTIHNTIVISLETINDQTIETKLLEGTFTK